LLPPEVQGPIYFGWSVSGAGDVNDDGYSDAIVGAPDWPYDPINPGRAYLFSGETGGCLDTLASPNDSYDNLFGMAVCGVGDINSDGYDDVVVGAPGEWAPLSGSGRAYVLDGETGDSLYSLTSPTPQSDGSFGYSVSGAGDVDGDDVPDVVIGAAGEGLAYVFSGEDRALLHTLHPQSVPPSAFGRSVSAAGDVDHDGYGDLVVGDNLADSTGQAYVFSGQNGSLLWTLESQNPKDYGNFGCCVSATGSPNGAGCHRVIVGAVCEDGGATEAGRAYVFGLGMSLSCTLSGGQLALSWTRWPGASSYWVYGTSNQAYFEPGFSPGYQHRLATLSPLFQTWSGPTGVGDPGANWTYLVLAVDNAEQELCRSNRVGEHDFEMTNDK
jgi:hypothetical protein